MTVPHQNVARCRDGESVSKVCLEGSECWLGCYSHEIDLLVPGFLPPFSYQWHQRHHPPSLHLYLFLKETFLYPLSMKNRGHIGGLHG